MHPVEVLPTEVRMQPRDPDYRNRVRHIMRAAPFIEHLGIEFDDVGPGWCRAGLLLEPRHRQQDGYVHAGVQATLADHVAGCAAFSLIPADRIILTVEFKINLLRPASGERLLCHAEVVRPGRRLAVVEASVLTLAADGSDTLCAKTLSTMAITADPAASAAAPE